MSKHGAPSNVADELTALDLSGVKVAIVAASWHEVIMNGLIDGAQRAARDAGIVPTLVRVPGTFELPVAASHLAQSYDAVVALGVVIRGGTPHFDYVCLAATNGLTDVSVNTRTPVGFGVLTCDDEKQALDRAGLEGSSEDKGYEAFSAAVMTVAALR
ncbi:6,7-dimethyl-8-ribityllumazine synthase [Glutamicibacter bergerei]|jgi:6,7-dimethyl-8-ribityllumazine synthase|uniref:6,7-dimethyl-8-ribityllumazine synthase n=2 Tax=Glutamicibacter TaxID=1742989 RepID=A0ABV9MNV2_9MICC|nr:MULTISPECIES: 6,7-dimethyl-8-ribityllumazine synthase [Glutamicibacter]PCC37394.1 6,7-dimethyl-8-ribityllumazine synthase [Glutamicibacter sp. BW77]GGJ63360.1 6,7-dimethyl-8-ribityllumazine synthase [Glutamicibacter ardleyensis]HBV10277.1 6,7-dimethyl-8-ribityllumazine synthase [Micrococcaceae bacterium]